MYLVTVTREVNGEVKATIHECPKIRDAGQVVAFCLDGNGLTATRKEATRLAMEFERTLALDHGGYSFRGEKVRKQKS